VSKDHLELFMKHLDDVDIYRASPEDFTELCSSIGAWMKCLLTDPHFINARGEISLLETKSEELTNEIKTALLNLSCEAARISGENDVPSEEDIEGLSTENFENFSNEVGFTIDRLSEMVMEKSLNEKDKHTFLEKAMLLAEKLELLAELIENREASEEPGVMIEVASNVTNAIHIPELPSSVASAISDPASASFSAEVIEVIVPSEESIPQISPSAVAVRQEFKAPSMSKENLIGLMQFTLSRELHIDLDNNEFIQKLECLNREQLTIIYRTILKNTEEGTDLGRKKTQQPQELIKLIEIVGIITSSMRGDDDNASIAQKIELLNSKVRLCHEAFYALLSNRLMKDMMIILKDQEDTGIDGATYDMFSTNIERAFASLKEDYEVKLRTLLGPAAQETYLHIFDRLGGGSLKLFFLLFQDIEIISFSKVGDKITLTLNEPYIGKINEKCIQYWKKFPPVVRFNKQINFSLKSPGTISFEKYSIEAAVSQFPWCSLQDITIEETSIVKINTYNGLLNKFIDAFPGRRNLEYISGRLQTTDSRTRIQWENISIAEGIIKDVSIIKTEDVDFTKSEIFIKG